MVAQQSAGGGPGGASPETVVVGHPEDPVDRFRDRPVPDWERRGDYRDIRYEVGDGVAKVTIARPEVRNAFRPQTLFELSDAFNAARDDDTVGVIIFTGAGGELSLIHI